MKERPILFSGAMVSAILSGTKTQTRRVAPVESFEVTEHDGGLISWAARFTKPLTKSRITATHSGGPFTRDQASRIVASQFCPYGQPGDRLWVRETWAHGIHAMAAKRDEDGPFVYAATDRVDQRIGERWKPSIHMPRCASRITLEITGVRVERLQGLSHDDAYDEGAAEWAAETVKDGNKYPSAQRAFQALWESINGPDSWDANPWVWAVSFKRVEQQR